MKWPGARRLAELIRSHGLLSSGKWFALALLVGLVAGLGAIAFHLLTQIALHFLLEGVAGYAPQEPAGEFLWFAKAHAPRLSLGWLFVSLLGGALVSGFLVYTFAPEAEGHGTDAAIEAFHFKRGRIRARIPLIKTLASAITLGSGGSGGREGPIAQIGAGFGSFLATRLQLTSRERRLLMSAGMGAGIGAIFRAPLAGALFASEILYSDAEFEADVIVPAVVSSIMAYMVYSFSLPASLRFTPLFGHGLDFAALRSPLELLPLSLLALVLVATGVVFIKTFYGTEHLFKRLPLLPHLRPALGALLVGAATGAAYLALGRDPRVLSVLSTGYGAIQTSLDSPDKLGVGLLLLVAYGKILTTSLTIGSGGSGGVFGPSVVIGGCVGGACGLLFADWWPGVVTSPQAYVILGMVGLFAGCAHTPISTVLMVFEMTGSYKLLVPTTWVATLCFLLCRPWTLYRKQVRSRADSPAHRGEFMIDVLEGLHVRDVFDPARPVPCVPESMTLDEIVHRLLPETEHSYFPVVDAEQRMAGVFTASDVRRFLYDGSIWQLAIARDLMVTRFLHVSPEDDLNTALRRFTEKNIDELPVIDPSQPGKLLGMLRRKDAIAFYNRRLLEAKRTDDDA